MIGNQAFHAVGVLLGLRDAATQLSAAETSLILDFAESAKLVVEIGVFEGVTSRRMIERMPKGGAIYCVDPFFPGRLGIAYGQLITNSQIRRAKRADIDCRVVRKFSHDFAPEAPDGFELVFIDADHSYEAVERDWRDWSRKVAIGGHIALHDSIPLQGRCPESCGPVRLVRELGTHPAGFELRATADTLSVYKRVA